MTTILLRAKVKRVKDLKQEQVLEIGSSCWRRIHSFSDFKYTYTRNKDFFCEHMSCYQAHHIISIRLIKLYQRQRVHQESVKLRCDSLVLQSEYMRLWAEGEATSWLPSLRSSSLKNRISSRSLFCARSGEWYWILMSGVHLSSFRANGSSRSNSWSIGSYEDDFI